MDYMFSLQIEIDNESKKNIQNEIKRLRSSEYYRNNKQLVLDKRKIKINCKCGKFVRKSTIARHSKSQFHIKNIDKEI